MKLPANAVFFPITAFKADVKALPLLAAIDALNLIVTSFAVAAAVSAEALPAVKLVSSTKLTLIA
ncbi:hypothetical protein D3C73_1586060 [compost metagenome]